MKTILIVDDDDAIREVYAEVLHDEGYATAQAANGAAALRELEVMAEPPSLVLLDVMMPTMSGPEMLRVLQATHRTAAIPVVLISASIITAEDIAGARRFVKKPVSVDVLLAIAREFCGAP